MSSFGCGKPPSSPLPGFSWNLPHFCSKATFLLHFFLIYTDKSAFYPSVQCELLRCFMSPQRWSRSWFSLVYIWGKGSKKSLPLQHIAYKKHGEICSLLHAVWCFLCLHFFGGWIGKQRALKQQINTAWDRLRLLLSAWSGGTRGSQASLASADASHEKNNLEERAQIFKRFMTQFTHFYYSSGYCNNSTYALPCS